MVSRLRSALAGAVIGVGFALQSVPCFAEPSAAQKETARGLMSEARELRDAGDLQAALKRFIAADSLMGVPTTGFEVAATQAQLGQLVEARDTLRRVLSIAPSPDDPEPFNEARSKANKLDQQLLSRIGALRFAIEGVGSAEVSVVVDGAAVPSAALGLPFRVNPGRHVVVARSGERQLRREIIAVESDTVEVQLRFSSASASAAPAPRPAPAARSMATPEEPNGGLPSLAYVGGGVAVVGILAGSVTGISAIAHRNAAKRDCVDGNCPPSTWGDLDKAHSMATASTVGFAVGVIGIGVAVSSILLNNKPSTARALHVSPEVGAQSARLTIGGMF